MARVQSGGGAYAGSLVFLGIGFFLSLVLAIVFFAQVGSNKEKARNAENTLNQLISHSESHSEWISNYKGSGATVVGRLHDELVQLKAIVGASANKNAEVIKSELARRDIDVSLISYVNDLENQRTVLESELEQLRDELDKAVDSKQQAQDEVKLLGERFEEAIKKLSSKVDQQSDLVKIIEEWLKDIDTELTQGSGETIADLQNQVDELRGQNATLEEKVRDLNHELAILRGKGGKVTLKKLTQPDGRIVTVLSDERKVYIDRGYDDHMILGMTFEVFDSDMLIILDEYQQLRGKATVEVVNVDDKASTARIVRRSRNAVIKESDVVANLVYDPDATMKFFVYGEFDIENTGLTSISDYKRVLSMIQRWDGVIAEELTYDVDFLVLGKEPPLPEPLPEGGVIDPKAIQEAVEKERAYKMYDELITKAKALNVPILNQNRFLALVGYYRR